MSTVDSAMSEYTDSVMHDGKLHFLTAEERTLCGMVPTARALERARQRNHLFTGFSPDKCGRCYDLAIKAARAAKTKV